MDVPKDVYPVGRLDYDSEGLLFLTNDTKMNHQLLHPSFEHKRTYWVQVEGAITIEAIERLLQLEEFLPRKQKMFRQVYHAAN